MVTTAYGCTEEVIDFKSVGKRGKRSDPAWYFNK
jgi:hypothetical protein